MRKFKFSLEKLLKLKEYYEKKKRLEFLDVQVKYSSLISESIELKNKVLSSYKFLQRNPLYEKNVVVMWNKAMDKRKEAEEKYKDLLQEKQKEYNKSRIEKRAFTLRKEKEWESYLKEISLEEDREVEDNFLPFKYNPKLRYMNE